MAGVTVKLVRVPDPEPDYTQRVSAGAVVREPFRWCARYALALPTGHDLEEASSWCLRRSAVGGNDGRGTPSPVEGFVWDTGLPAPKGSGAAVLARLDDIARNLPEDILALEGNHHEVALCWMETGEIAHLEQVLSGLVVLSDLQIQFDRTCRTPSDGHIRPQAGQGD